MTQSTHPVISLVNGSPQNHLNIQDRAIQYGDGLFETIRVKQGQSQYWSEHMQRLQKGCNTLKMVFPEAILVKESNRLISESSNGVLKIILSRGSGERGYKIVDTHQSRILSFYPNSQRKVGPANLRLCNQRLGINPSLAGIKHLNRLEQVLARSEWDDEYDEGVMLDTEGRVIEATMSNLFLLKDNVVITPKLTRCGVAGIMRQQILNLAKRLKIETSIQDVSPPELEKADDVFLSNSIFGIWPVSSFENIHWKTGVITKRLMSELDMPW